ncbi:hypothetical protein [Saccharothrix algeriensis]|uniref:Uncharacterized protein n=2 Tax=Saccharothrix algeriensis TaxID=173560 RepID=A0ABS2S918_9PSEU|nr:hypothetical protein [Saccharothrix algeriensis]MBM7812736.1 hypothetical protein [Saccharothrix algeriensis]
MSAASDRLAAAKNRLDQISREHSDRRELRERRSREARDKAGESLDKQAAAAQKTIERIQEAGKRQKAAGGWGTAAATAKKGGEFRFGAEDDEPTYETAGPGTGWTAGPATPPPGSGWTAGPATSPSGSGWAAGPATSPPGSGWTAGAAPAAGRPTAPAAPAPARAADPATPPGAGRPATPPPVTPPPARPAPRRPAPVEDDDDFGGQSWLT